MLPTSAATVLVCGSEGSLMQAVIPYLQEQGYSVVGVDNFFRYGQISRVRNYTFIKGDLDDQGFVDNLFSQHQFDFVIQAAARIFGVRGFHKYPADILCYDVQLHKNVLLCAVKYHVKRVAYISSSMVYERASTFPSKEEDVDNMLVPLTDYGLSKLVGERLSKAFWVQYSLPYTIWRPFNIITSYERGEQEVGLAHVFADLIKKILIDHQNPVEILGDGEQVRSFTWIDEVARAIAYYSFDERTKCQAFNLGQYRDDSSGEWVSINKLAQKVFEKGQQRGIIPAYENLALTHINDPLITKTDVQKRVPDSNLAHETFGWVTRVGIDQALDQCLDQIIKEGLVKAKA